jgi:hypothetical protein
MFYRWWRMEEEDRGRVWRLYGWYSGLMACGSCFGAVAWAAWMLLLVNFYKANTSTDPVQRSSLFALAFSWRAAFTVTYPIEFMCMCAANLMVLDRLSVFAAPQGTRLQKLWALAGRVVMAAVVLGNAVGLAANAAAAVHYQKAAQADSTSSAYYAANNTKDGDIIRFRADEEVQRGGSIASFQLFCEVAVLLFIVVAFAVVGALCRRLLSSRFRPIGVDAGYDAFMLTVGRTLRRQMLGTTGFVFVTFVVRSVFSILYATAFQFRDTRTASCPGVCDECHNAYYVITMWMVYTPQFQTTIVLVSSPLALLVALWGMTPKHMLQPLKSSKRDKAFPLAVMPPPKEEESSMA